jgi:hypothetical protein
MHPSSRFLNSSTTSPLVQTVSPAPLTVTADNQARLYGDPNPAFTGPVIGVQNNDAITATYATTATPASNVGSYAIVPTLLDPNNRLRNYSVTVHNGTLTVKPALLTVTAADATRTYGSPNPSFTGTISGIKNNDNITAVYSAVATQASDAGTYAITPTLIDPGSRLGNYTVTVHNGTLTITQAHLTVIANDLTVLVHAPSPAMTYTITGSSSARRRPPAASPAPRPWAPPTRRAVRSAPTRSRRPWARWRPRTTTSLPSFPVR